MLSFDAEAMRACVKYKLLKKYIKKCVSEVVSQSTKQEENSIETDQKLDLKDQETTKEVTDQQPSEQTIEKTIELQTNPPTDDKSKETPNPKKEEEDSDIEELNDADFEKLETSESFIKYTIYEIIISRFMDTVNEDLIAINQYYNKEKIVGGNFESQKIALCTMINKAIKTSLNLLCINVVDAM